jgi:NAD-dependent dihydropyrimidine dehydrogenase PreA subunit
MTYVINEPCIGAKDTSCVEVCPVDWSSGVIASARFRA